MEIQVQGMVIRLLVSQWQQQLRGTSGVGGVSTFRFLLCAAIVSTCLMVAPIQAQDTGPGADSLPAGSGSGRGSSLYVSLGPSFVTNYDGGGRLKYLKADVTLRVRPPAEVALERHLPYIRNRLVLLFSQQLEEDLTSTDGKEALRAQALKEVRDALDLLDRPGLSANITELYFTAYVLQR
jgi:flagellar protein FliL